MKTNATLIIMLASALSLSAYEMLVPENGRRIWRATPNATLIRGPVHPALEVGLALGSLEMGSRQGVEPEILVGHLKLAKRHSEGSTIGPLKGIDQLIVEMEATKDSREVHASVIAFRERVEEQIWKAYPKPPPVQDPVSSIKTAKCESAEWEGEWSTRYGTMKLRLTDDGRVVGWYGTETKTLDGTIDPNDPGIFRGKWRYTNSGITGAFEFRWVARGKFKGAWTSGSTKPADVAVNWSGSKVNTALPRIPEPKGAFHCKPADWAGVWRTNYGTMTLAFHGEGTLAGRYGPSQHTVKGRLNSGDPTVYSGVWKYSTSDWTGLFRLRMTGKGTFEGAWISGDQNPTAVPVNWTGTKVEDDRSVPPKRTAAPEPGPMPTPER